MHNKDSDQTAQVRRLIQVSAGSTCHFDGFVVLWLKWSLAAKSMPEGSLWKRAHCECTELNLNHKADERITTTIEIIFIPFVTCESKAPLKT